MRYMLDHLKQKECVIMDNVLIHEMNKEDIDSAIQVEKTQNTHILNSNILKDDLEKGNYHYIVAKYNNKVVGYAGISYILDSADLISIVVDKDFSHKGIATQLLENIFEFCKSNNIKKILLEVRKSNNIAISLYLKNGFKKISERKKYYDNTEDAYIFLREL